MASGRGDLDKTFRGMNGLIDALIHVTSNHRVTSFTGRTATGTVHVHVKGSYLGTAIEIIGYYEDKYARHDAQWLSARRRARSPRPSVSTRST